MTGGKEERKTSGQGNIWSQRQQGGGTVIQRLELHVSLERLKDLPLLFKLIDDIKEKTNGNVSVLSLIHILSPVPAVIRKYSKDIAVYNLISRAGIDEGERENNYLTRYKNAIAFLTKVAKGETDIVKEGTDPSKAAAEGFRISSSTRLFSRATMRGL